MEEQYYNTTALTYANLCSIVRLQAAWKKVAAKNSAGGIDQFSVDTFKEDLDRHLDQLLKALRTGTYMPEPYLTIHIPKDENEQRRLGLLSIKDKLVQQAILDLIQPDIDAKFLDCSYGYRRDKGPVRAVNGFWEAIKTEGYKWFVKLDLDNFFDNIPHQRLFERLSEYIPDKELCNLIRLCMRMGRVDRRLNWTDNNRGTPQGALLSPLMANLYLHDLDVFMTKQQVGYIRYADDFLVLTKNETRARAAFKEIREFLDKELQLPLNPDTQIAPLTEGILFLGITFYEKYYRISDAKRQDLKKKIEESFDLSKGTLPLKFLQTVDGIRQYYGKVLYESSLIPLDELIEKLIIEAVEQHGQIFRTQKSIRRALSSLNFITDSSNQRRKTIIDTISGKKNIVTNRETLEIGADLLIQRRKRQYEDMQSAGMELLISQSGISVSVSRRGISIKRKGKNILTAPTANVRHISIISKGIVLSSRLVTYCARKDIPIDFFDYEGKPIARIYDPDTTDDQLWLAQLQTQQSERACKLVKAIVAAKIGNQINLLKYYGKYRKGEASSYTNTLSTNLEKLALLLEKVQAQSEVELSTLRLKLFGLEGQAGRLYWEMIDYLLAGKIRFNGRERKGAQDTLNVMLNYGYGILYSRLWDAALKARLNPYISFLHVRQAGKPTLTFDLIEEFRQVAVDKVVFAMVSKGEKIVVRNGRLDEASRKKLAGKVLSRLNEVEDFRSTRIRLSQIIRYQAESMGRFFLDERNNYKPYRLKW